MELFVKWMKEYKNREVVVYDGGFAVYQMNDDACYIEDVFVDEHLRMQGLADKMGRDIENAARIRGCKNLFGSVSTHHDGAHKRMMALIKRGYELSSIDGTTIYFCKELK